MVEKNGIVKGAERMVEKNGSLKQVKV